MVHAADSHRHEIFCIFKNTDQSHIVKGFLKHHIVKIADQNLQILKIFASLRNDH